jgi:AraC family transcriptional regulator of adaptative response/methylated-DNA-[protein]-cysteine methyltransferase
MLLQLFTDDESRWTAMRNRDTSADGRFVYAVASTRIYCRPSCPSRRAHPRHVRFFDLPQEAEAEGYRACRRCHPRDPETAAGRRIRAAQRYLEQHLDETVTLERLGREVRMSPYHLQRTFKRLTGTTPRGYASARRLEQMKSRLKEGKSVTRATYDAGYSSASRAYDSSRARLGMTPATYRRGGEGVRIAYAVVPTEVGQLLVAGTERGICAVTLGDDAETLETALRAEYPAAMIERGDGELDAWTRAVVDHLTGVGGGERVPLDLRGTAFQREVWETLQRIPRGATRSYTEIARELGRPAAARAVAQACASNRLALVIPCHRVVREDGGLGGYRWGMERKRALLERERSAS